MVRRGDGGQRSVESGGHWGHALEIRSLQGPGWGGGFLGARGWGLGPDGGLGLASAVMSRLLCQSLIYAPLCLAAWDLAHPGVPLEYWHWWWEQC